MSAIDPYAPPFEHAVRMSQAFEEARRRYGHLGKVGVYFNPQTKVFRVLVVQTGDELLRGETWEEFWSRLSGEAPPPPRQSALVPTEPTHTRRERKRARRR